MINEILFFFAAYLIGSIPTAVWIGRLKYGVDVREHGSKNAGATNTFRVLGKKPGIVVLLIDILKGFIAVNLPLIFLTVNHDELVDLEILAAIGAVLGHVFPIYVGFKGGKGVATSLGIIIGIHPPAAGICLLIFLIVFLSFKYVSLGAILASVVFPLLIHFVFKDSTLHLILFSYLLGLTVILAHHKNIKRLLKGEESKMNLFKK